MKLWRLAAAVAATLVVAACATSETTAPEVTALELGRSGGSDTTTAGPATIRIAGQVLGVERRASDTSGSGGAFVPIAGAEVRIMRNYLLNGQAAQELVATVTTNAAGEYAIPTLPGAYYVAYATPPAASAYAATWELVQRVPEVRVNLYAFRKDGGS